MKKEFPRSSDDIQSLLNQVDDLRQEKKVLENQLKAIRTSVPYLIWRKAKLFFSSAIALLLLPVTLMRFGKRIFQNFKRLPKYRSLIKNSKLVASSNGHVIAGTYDLKVAIVTDRFMFNFYKDVFSNVYWLTPDNYEKVLDEHTIDVFFYISCWRGGDNNEWRGHMENELKFQKILDIIGIAKSQGAKTVFQTIEDPVHYEYFLKLAKNFDYIYTSDISLLERYRVDLPNVVTNYGEYGVNPVFNNPISSVEHICEDVFFAGTYHKKYKNRCLDADFIFDSLMSNNLALTIADRNLKLNLTQYSFPERFQCSVIPPFDHDQLQRVHKLFAVNVNLNSIQNSPSMCAMRVYELQAQGSLLLSNYAESVTSKFPTIDILAADKQLGLYYRLIGEELLALRRSVSVTGILKDKTAYYQVGKILSDLDIAHEKAPTYRILAIASDAEFNFPLTSNDYRIDIKSVFTTDDIEEYDFITFLGDGNYYGYLYMESLFIAFKYTDVAYVTKNKYYKKGRLVGSHEYDFTNNFASKYLTLFNLQDYTYDELTLLTDQEQNTRRQGFSVDRCHVNFDDWIEKEFQSRHTHYALSVIVPVYNNGRFLRDCCLNSLHANKNFFDFDIILVNDSSTCDETNSLLKEIHRIYPNVQLLESPLNTASMSASYPKNLALQYAKSEKLTFLDPGNQISPGGYDNLLQTFGADNDIDAVFGYQVTIPAAGEVIGKLYEQYERTCEDPKSNILLNPDISFPTISAQAAVISKSMLEDNEIDYINDPFCQDTVFGYEVLACAKKVVFSHAGFIEHYEDRRVPVINSFDLSFFKRSLSYEQEKRKRLRKRGLWNDYRSHCAQADFEASYLERYRGLCPENQKKVSEYLMEIAEINQLQDFEDHQLLSEQSIISMEYSESDSNRIICH